MNAPPFTAFHRFSSQDILGTVGGVFTLADFELFIFRAWRLGLLITHWCVECESW